MANNRMWLVCRSCGSKVLLAKCGLGEYVLWGVHMASLGGNKPLVQRVNSFMEKHTWCDCQKCEHKKCEQDNEYECGGVSKENEFEIAYDFARDEGIKEV